MTATDANAARERSDLHRALARNLDAVRARVDAAAVAAGRSDRPQLLAVTKSVEPDVARALVEVGARDLGENRLQVLEPKRAALDAEPPTAPGGAPLPPPRWHFVGHLQRNKASRVLRQVDVLHSADSPRLVDALVVASERLDRPVEVFAQVKLWPEDDKGGLAPDELHEALDRLAAAPRLVPVGLMTMAPLLESPEACENAARRVFRELAERSADLAATGRWFDGPPQLSMGMSDDLEAAVAAGSHWLRIGRALFGDLPRPHAPRR